MPRWGLDVALLVPGLPFTGDTLEREGLGGSETAGLYMARELARLGHHVQVFSSGDRRGIYDGVAYRRLDEFSDYATNAPHDVTVVQRAPEIFAARMNSKLNILWCHDLAVGRRGDTMRAALWNIDKVAVLSTFMAAQYRETYKLPDELLWQTRNGIDFRLFDDVIRQEPRDRKLLIFGARPERGLDVLVDHIFPALLAKDPELRLAVATYGNEVAHLQGFYGAVKARIAQLGDRVISLPPLPKAEYYQLLGRAGVYVYPTPSPTQPAFDEVSCITAMECQAAGLPIVASRRGALPETIDPRAGVLIDGDPTSERAVEAFCDAVLRYTQDDIAWKAASAAGRLHAAGLGWAAVAEEWSDAFGRFIEERNESPSRLVHHFIRRSDITAARALVETMPEGDERQGFQARLAEWDFAAGGPDEVREQYEKIGRTHTDVFRGTTEEPRFQLLEQWLRDRPEVQHILDYGCAHGSYAINLANRLGRSWVGVDIDRYSINWALRNRDARQTNPNAHLDFRLGTAADIDLGDAAPFDALIAFEVVEHLTDPTTTLDQLERWIRPDGLVVITVPFGPWEWMSYRSYPHRAHLWEFDLHDLRDLFGKKKDLRITAVTAGRCEDLGETLGWHLIEYRVDGTPTGTIDLARKLRLQRPRQTVTALMIAGPDSEETLGWALAPTRDLVDEIVIGDCGMSDLARQIAAGYGARLVPASDPIANGFEAPRNDALAHARMDFILWFDSDERLVGGSQLNKYLRANAFSGYSIRQHNFSCDAPHEPTLPVRLFRRGPRSIDGRTLRWYGMIHEHPEYALNEGPGLTIILRDVHLAHVGYVSGAQQMARFERNKPLLVRDLQAYPDRRLQKHFLCRDLIQQARFTLAANGRKVTAEIETMCREVLRLYREHFLGQGTYLNIDTLQYYSTALMILGEGVEVAFSTNAAKDGVEPGEVIQARFASYEEAERELQWRLKAAMTPYLSKYW